MKAEHRKELQTNTLADRLGKFVQNLRSGNNSASVIFWVFLLLAVSLFAAWRWFGSASLSTRSALWTRLDTAENVQDYENLANERGAVPALYARFQMARSLMEHGLRDIYADDPVARSAAAQSLEKARDQYDLLTQTCSEPALLHQEALMGAAKAEEALLGAAKGDDPNQGRGDVERMMNYYRRLAQAKPSTFLVEEAEKKVKELDNPEKRGEFLAVYAGFRNRAAGPRGFPGGTPGGFPGGMRDPHEGLNR